MTPPVEGRRLDAYRWRVARIAEAVIASGEVAPLRFEIGGPVSAAADSAAAVVEFARLVVDGIDALPVPEAWREGAPGGAS